MLEIIDTSGTEQFVTMRDVYIKNSDGCLVVYTIDSVASFNDAKDIFKQIARVKDADKVRVVLVGNKCDLEHDRVVAQADGRILASSLGGDFVEASAKNDVNVSTAFEKLLALIDEGEPRIETSKPNRCIVL